MKKPLFLLIGILFILSFGVSNAQKMETKFTPINKVNGGKEGLMSSFIGDNETHLFAYYNELKPIEKEKNRFIVAIDKKTMKESSRIYLTGKGSARIANLKKAKIQSTKVTSKGLILLWKFKESGNEILKIETLNNKLEAVKKPTEIYNSSKLKSKDAELVNFILVASKTNPDIFCVVHESTLSRKDKSSKVGYTFFNLDLSDKKEGVVDFSELANIKSDKISNFIKSTTFHLASNGNLFMNIRYLDESERVKEKFKDGKVAFNLVEINPEEKTINQTAINHPKMQLNSVFLLEKDDEIIVTGTFRDPDLFDVKKSEDGLYRTKRNPRTNEIEDVQFSYFTQEVMDKLYQRRDMTKREERKTDKKLKKSGSNAKSDGKIESVLGFLNFDYVDINDNEEIFLVTSFTYNYTVRVCSTVNNVTTCTDVPYCRRSDVNSFLLDTKGEILLANNYRRVAVYRGWDIEDINVVKKENDFYIFYKESVELAADGTRDKKAEKLKKKMEKAKKVEILDYLYVSSSEGTMVKKSHEMPMAAKKSERQSMDPMNIYVGQNEVYSYNFNKSLKPYAPVLMPLSLLIVPYYIYAYNPTILRSYKDYLVEIKLK